MTNDDIVQLKSSCITAAAFIGITALTIGVLFQTMIG